MKLLAVGIGVVVVYLQHYYEDKILRTDPITQMVCGTCCQITLNVFTFRTKSIKNDKDLKTKHAQFNITQLQNQSGSSHSEQPSSMPAATPAAPPPPIPQKYIHAHSSVKAIIKKFPNLKLPDLPLKSHFSPYITLLNNEVEDWFKQNQNLSQEEIDSLMNNSIKKRKPYGPRRSSDSSLKRKAEDITTPKHPNNFAVRIIKKKFKASPVEPPVSNKEYQKPLQSVDEIAGSSQGRITRGATGIPSLQRRKNTVRKTTRPITYNEDITSDIPGSVPHISKESNTVVVTNGLKSVKTHVNNGFRPATNITAELVDPDTDTDDSSATLAYASSLSSRSTTPSVSSGNDAAPPNSLTSTSDASDVNMKSDFVKSLALTPRTEMPASDLLLSQRNKSLTLYTCKVCDSHFYNTKELRHHERKTHTKCAYCNKRFRSLASRDEHSKSCNLLQIPPMSVKDARLELERVDNDPSIRMKYDSAFTEQQNVQSAGVDQEMGNTSQPNVEQALQDLFKSPPNKTIQNSSVERNTSSKLSNEEMQQASVTPTAQQNIQQAKAPVKDKVALIKDKRSTIEKSPDTTKRGDVICISDEETEIADIEIGNGKRKINISYPEILRNIHLHGPDKDILKSVITAVEKQKKDDRHVIVTDLKNNPITTGANLKTRVFKNLRQHLFGYKLPVEISYKPEMRVSFKNTMPPPVNQVTDLWLFKPYKDLDNSASNNNVTNPSTPQPATVNATAQNLAAALSASVANNHPQLYNMLQGIPCANPVSNIIATSNATIVTPVSSNKSAATDHSQATTQSGNHQNRFILPLPPPASPHNPPVNEFVRTEAERLSTRPVSVPNIRVKNLQELS